MLLGYMLVETSENEMLNRYNKPGSTLFIGKIMHDMKKMKAELKEHRYHLERSVALKTEHLLKRIDLLESCNATLCCKLTLAQKEIYALKPAQTFVHDAQLCAAPESWRELAIVA